MRTKLLILHLCISCVVLSSCHRAPVVESPMQIDVAQVQLDTISRRQSFISSVSSNFESVVQPRVQGFLAASYFENGMPVRAGQLIFKLDGREQRAARMAATAALESARVTAIEARNSYERAVPLAEIEAISRAQLDQYTAKYAAAKSAVNSAEQQLENATLAESYTRIHSPINGIISTSNAHIGDYVGPGTKFATLTTIRNLDSVSVDLALPMNIYLAASGRRNFTYDNNGLLSHIELYLADGSRYPHAGFYKFTRQNIADAMGAIVLVVGFPNPDFALKAGQFARVEANVGAAAASTTIPQRAVTQVQNISSVWVVGADSVAEYRKVTLGRATADGRYVVIEGVAPGESVALTGLQKLRNGMKVHPLMKGGAR